MGCCLSTTTATTNAAADHHRRPPKTPVSHSPPPPPLFEEETVKEVLSETPIVPKHHPPLTVVHSPENEILQPEEPKAETIRADSTKNPTVEITENVSEISEMYSYSESFSAATTTTTTTVADKKDEIDVDDDGEVTQKVKKNKSPPAKKGPRKRPVGSSGEFGVRKERSTARPTGRRQMAPSPEKKRQSPSRTTANAPRHRNVGSLNDGRRDGGARRSRSPAVRGETCQSRKVGEKGAAEKPSAVDDGGVSPVPEAVAEAVVEAVADAVVEAEASESLENPLVSLECFIFL